VSEARRSRSAIRNQLLNGKGIPVKPIFGRAVKYIQFVALFVAVASLGVLMGRQGLTHQDRLIEKRASLERENEDVVKKIKSLEREVTLLRSDTETIAKVAKRKLGMALPDETVYVFEPRQKHSKPSMSADGLFKQHNMP